MVYTPTPLALGCAPKAMLMTNHREPKEDALVVTFPLHTEIPCHSRAEHWYLSAAYRLPMTVSSPLVLMVMKYNIMKYIT